MTVSFGEYAKPASNQSFFQRKKIVIIVSVIAVVSVITGVGLYFFLRKNPASPTVSKDVKPGASSDKNATVLKTDNHNVPSSGSKTFGQLFAVEFGPYTMKDGAIAKIINITSEPVKVEWAFAVVMYKDLLFDAPVKADFRLAPNEAATIDMHSSQECGEKGKIPKEHLEFLESLYKKRDKKGYKEQAKELKRGVAVMLDRMIVAKVAGQELQWGDQIEQATDSLRMD